MDQIKIGKFIALLRKQYGLTQEALGERIGVTNKTISRWENGIYLPDIEMLQQISQAFDVSVNELLAGEFLSDEEFRKKAYENIMTVSSSITFSLEERKAYFKKKWRKEHISLFVILGVLFFASVMIPLLIDKTWMIGVSGLIAVAEYGYQNNRMMIYVENHLYD